jgi:excisionase family DNA binding protein
MSEAAVAFAGLVWSDDGERFHSPPAAWIRNGELVNRRLLNVDAADVLAMSRASLYRLIRRGEIPVVKIGVMTRLEASVLESYVEQLRTERERSEATVSWPSGAAALAGRGAETLRGVAQSAPRGRGMIRRSRIPE